MQSVGYNPAPTQGPLAGWRFWRVLTVPHLWIRSELSDKGGNGTRTIDEEAERLGLSIGLIKADFEGWTYALLQGAKNVLVKHRPILSLAIYHPVSGTDTCEPLVVPTYVKSFGYRLFLYQAGDFDDNIGELSLFAVPSEIARRLVWKDWFGYGLFMRRLGGYPRLELNLSLDG